MDKITAQGLFKSQILGRWPDFELSSVLYDDWINLLSKHTPDDVCRAAGQYVLNHDAFKRPSLSKFKEILDAISASNHSSKVIKEEKYPQYYLQQDDKDCKNWAYGTYTAINVPLVNPDIALTYVHSAKERYEQLYGGDWKVVICYNKTQRNNLVKDRATKNRKGTTDGKQPENGDKLFFQLRKSKDSFGGKSIQQNNDQEDVSQV